MPLEMSINLILGKLSVSHCPRVAKFSHSRVWITALLSLRFPFPFRLGSDSSLLYPANGSQLEIHLMSAAVPALPSIPCDVVPVFLDLPVVMCRTRYTCPGTRSDKTSALLISVIFGSKLEQLLLWLQLSTIVFKKMYMWICFLKGPYQGSRALGRMRIWGRTLRILRYL